MYVPMLNKYVGVYYDFVIKTNITGLKYHQNLEYVRKLSVTKPWVGGFLRVLGFSIPSILAILI